MRINEHTAISTPRILLVPYTAAHVPTYHQWMSDPDLQKATASEPLTVEEEYAMQQSWRKDTDKLTFIACLPLDAQTCNVSVNVDDSSEKMIGDINLFLFNDEDDIEEVTTADTRDGSCAAPISMIGEIELMIARTDLHRQGYGRAALLAFVDYILCNQDSIKEEYCEASAADSRLRYLRVKIDQDNCSSIGLFESVGFTRIPGGPNYFGEVELRWDIDESSRTKLRALKAWQAAHMLAYV